MSRKKSGRIILFVIGGVLVLLTIIGGSGVLLARNILTSFDTHKSKMCLRTDLDVQSSQLWYSPGMDSVMWCRLVVKADSIDEIFDRARVNTIEFADAGIRVDAAGNPRWWDADDYELVGGEVELRPNQEYMRVGYFDNGDGTLIVFLIWFTV